MIDKFVINQLFLQQSKKASVLLAFFVANNYKMYETEIKTVKCTDDIKLHIFKLRCSIGTQSERLHY